MTILDTLKHLNDTRHDEINRWLAAYRREAAPFIFTSVDLRHSGLRVAPVDTNLFPAGFNNLSPAAARRAAEALRDYLETHVPRARRVLIIAESHTRNLPYLDNLARLRALFAQCGLAVEFANFTAADAPTELQSPGGETIVQHPLTRVGAQLAAGDFVPDIVVLNNDLTAGMPPVLESIAQPVFPPPAMGWHQRRKSVHFAAYRQLAEDFGAAFGLDPWLICAYSHHCGMIDFRAREGLDSLARGVDCVIAKARRKHAEYGLAEDPYVFVKADSGTYGMGIMTARDGAEMLELNKKERNKMQVIKEGVVSSEVIIQEGIPTIDRVKGAPAEPLIYLVDGIPVGGLYRVNESRDAFNNLNAAGMTITGMCDEQEGTADKVAVRGCHFQAFGLISAIAALAAPRENVQSSADRKLCAQP